MGQLISSSQVFATPGMSPSRKRSGPAGIELTRRTAASKHPATKHRYVESQLPEGGRFAMITTLFTNSISWVGRG